jgi:hypothetical protein
LSSSFTCEGEVGLDHALHLVEVFLHRARLGRVADHRKREAEACEHRAQIVAYPIEHRRALLDGTLDAPLHLDKSMAGLPHFARALRPEMHLSAFAESFGGARQAQNRLDLIAQERNRNEDKDQRRSEHPHDENMRVRGVSLTAMRDDAHHGILELDADFDQIGAADRIEPKRATDLATDFV